MNKVILVSPSRLVTDPARNPRFAKASDPAQAAREFYAGAAYKTLCDSFRASGITIPITVMKRKGTGYTVLEGFSRAHWAKREMKRNPSLRVPVNVLENAKDAKTAAVAMNTARIAYDPIAKAGSFAALVDEWGNVKQAALRAGVSPATIREGLRLLRLPTRAQRMIQSGKLSVANANKITRLPGWDEYQKARTGASMTPRETKIANEFKTHLTDILSTMQSMEAVPDVGSTRTNRRKQAAEADGDAIVLPTIDSLREACHLYGRRLARLYLSGVVRRVKEARYTSAIEHLAAAMGWAVPKSLEGTLKDADGNPLYTAKTNARLRREIVNEYTLAGTLAIAHREGRNLRDADELRDDENWLNFVRQNVPLESLVQRLNRRLV